MEWWCAGVAVGRNYIVVDRRERNVGQRNKCLKFLLNRVLEAQRNLTIRIRIADQRPLDAPCGGRIEYGVDGENAPKRIRRNRYEREGSTAEVAITVTLNRYGSEPGGEF